jgi:4-hydroxybenzoate polyprenyltransferase
VAALAVRGFERAARLRNPAFVLYAALPLLGIAAASGGASNLQADPLNALTLGILVACLARPPVAAAA